MKIKPHDTSRLAHCLWTLWRHLHLTAEQLMAVQKLLAMLIASQISVALLQETIMRV